MKTPGLVVPPLTPFKDDLSVDFDVLQREVDCIVEDCDAMMVSAAGVETTEYRFLTFEERCELIRRTVELSMVACHPSLCLPCERGTAISWSHGARPRCACPPDSRTAKAFWRSAHA